MSHPQGTPVRLVIFDCDGVLVDSERLAVRIEAALISELGWPITEAEVLERFVGRSDTYRDDRRRRHGRPGLAHIRVVRASRMGACNERAGVGHT
ncbi:MAG: hypothetical protein ABI658_09860 [Acidimicrobiales bacterium]